MSIVRITPRVAAAFALASALVAPIVLDVPRPAQADCLVSVDASNPACTNSGPGFPESPFCSISAAVSMHGGPGTTIRVRAGVYHEQINVTASGQPGMPLVIEAVGGPVLIDGADDYTRAAQWAAFAGNVWQARGVRSRPQQVFADGDRMTASTDTMAALVPGTYRYVSGQGLFVNVGGGNPSSHDLRVGRYSNGFRLSRNSWVVIRGFTLTRQEDRGFNMLDQCSDVTIEHNDVSMSRHYGISAIGCTRLALNDNRVYRNGDHGMYLSDVSASTLFDNETFENARPTERAANGIYMYGSSGNRIQGNRVHHNQDAGLELEHGSNNNISLQNVAWENGDHGFEHLECTGTVHVGDVAWRNYKDGISIEGLSTGTRVVDCIAVDNGVTTNEFDIYVDPGSTAGFSADHNIYWNSVGQAPIKFDNVRYATVAEYTSATGHDASTLQADPRFANPAGGDFHLVSGSPAIDSGDSSVPDWPATDAEDRLRADDPATPNTGVAPIVFADRGAFEYLGVPEPHEPIPLPTKIVMYPPYPNPSRGAVGFAVELPTETRVTWEIHDLQGRMIAGAACERDLGRTVVSWNGLDQNGRRPKAGLYFVRVFAGQASTTKSFVLLR